MTWNLSKVISAFAKVRLDPRFERRPHVDAGVGDRLALAAMRLEEIREFLYRRGILAVGCVDHFAPRHVDEQADVVVAAPRRGFVGGDPPHLRQIQRLHRAPHVMFDDPPQARVVLANPLGRIGDRHRLGQRQHVGLEQQREPGARPSPRRGDLAHPARRTDHPRHASVQERAVLEEVQMPPGLLLRVVNRATLAAALGAGEPAPARKIHVQIELTIRDRKRAPRHRPRRLQPKGQLEKIGVSHPLTINPIKTHRSPSQTKNPPYPLNSARSHAVKLTEQPTDID